MKDHMNADDPRAHSIADLAESMGIDADEVDVVAYENVTWRDGSLGCAKAGVSYTQALVDGYRIALRAKGKDVAYHGRAGQPPFRCDHPDPTGAIEDATGR
jgi:hypothetical protein